MRWLIAISVAMALAPLVAGAAEFPFQATVSKSEVNVRSGPGTRFYPTGKLRAGENVEVYEVLPDGWLAIRPPDGSFSWVLARQLRIARNVPATAARPHVAARVGSTLGDVRDVIQVRLDEREPVEILESKGNWCKIAPPPGEFRYVSERDVTPNAPILAKQNVEGDQPAAPAGAAEEATASLASHIPAPAVSFQPNPPLAAAPDEKDTPAPMEKEAAPPAGMWRVADRKAKRKPPANSTAVTAPATQPTGSAVALAGGLTTIRAAPPAPAAPPANPSRAEWTARLASLELELSSLLIQDPSAWTLDSLREKARELTGLSDDPLDRGQLRAFEVKLDRWSELRERHQRWGRPRAAGTLGTGQTGAGDAQFDGTGRLLPVATRSPNSPPYALVDAGGMPLFYVTPSPGVNLASFRNQEVGVYGTRHVLADGRTKHIHVQRLVPLEN